MNRTFSTILTAAAILAFGTAVRAADGDEPATRTVTLRSGKVLQDAYILDKKPNGVTVAHKDGAMFIPFSDMPLDYQKKFGYDPIKSARYEKKLIDQKKIAEREEEERKAKEGVDSAAIELEDGTIITAHTSALLGPCAALLLNATKHLAGIDHEVKLIPQAMIEPIQTTKVNFLQGNNPRLHTDEVLVAISMLSLWDENCKKALECLPQLKGCQVHCTVMLSEVDRKIFKKLGIGFTSDPVAKK